MSQPPYEPDDTQPGGWGAPVPPVGVPTPSAPPPPAAQPYGAPPPYGSQPYGAQPYGSESYGSQPYAAQPYGSAPYGGQPYAEQPYPAQPGGPWTEQPYGYPGYGPYGEPPRRGNGMAVAGFVLSFFFGLLGLIFSIIGLRRSGEPGRGGRGLAIAGIVISAVNLVFWVLVGIGLASGSTTTGDSSDIQGSTNAGATSSPAPAPAPAPAAGSETVADACHVIIPALTGMQADLQNASSPADMIDKINALADTVEQQGEASGDPVFTQHSGAMADQFRAVLQAVKAGHAPDFASLAKASEQLGYDCAQAGVTA